MIPPATQHTLQVRSLSCGMAIAYLIAKPEPPVMAEHEEGGSLEARKMATSREQESHYGVRRFQIVGLTRGSHAASGPSKLPL